MHLSMYTILRGRVPEFAFYVSLSPSLLISFYLSVA